MTNTEKPTPGPWEVGQHPAIPNSNIVNPVLLGGRVRVLHKCEGGHVMLKNKADADLIAEAGTVYHETNLTPRQLLERVRELEAGQKALLSTLKTYVSSMQIIHEPGRSEAINAADAAAKHIIARFEDAALAKHGEEVS